MGKDNFIITIESVQGTFREIADRARTTIGMEPGKNKVTSQYIRKMYLCEHSPIRIRSFIIRIENVPYWISTHMVRHHVGYTPFITTERDDRNPKILDRDATPQGNLVTLEIHANTQAIINVSRKRLCTGAHPRTRELWKQVLEKLKEVDPTLVSCCVPDCVYRGWCYEHKCCGYHHTPEFRAELAKYRYNINQLK